MIFDDRDRFPEAMIQMIGWVQEGKLGLDDYIVEGIETFPEALRMLFDGRTKGKLIVNV